MPERAKLPEGVRKLERFVSYKNVAIPLPPEPIEVTIEAVVNESPEKWCSACLGPAPVGVTLEGVRGTPDGSRFLFCHACSDRIGGQSARLSHLLREQLGDGNHEATA